MNKIKQITQYGYDQLLITKQKLIIELNENNIVLDNARARGDLSENADFHATRDNITNIKKSLENIDLQLGCVVITPIHPYDGTIGFGTKFIANVPFIDNNVECQIVGSVEADILIGKFSFNNEIGAMLMGKKSGDVIQVNKNLSIKIIEILKN